MATLTTYASEVDSRVEPATKFFDPSASLGIMQRYGMSGQSRAFAEDALKSANQIDAAVNYDPQNRRNDLERHDWAREAKDREDKSYEEKKLYETTLAESVMAVSELSIDDPEFDNRIGGFLGNPEAMKNDAVRALVNFKIQQRETKSRDNSQKLEYEKRLGDEIIQLTGAPPEQVWSPDGIVNRDNMPTLFNNKAINKANAEAAEKQRGEILDEIGKNNAVLLDQSHEYLTASRSSRAKSTVDAATANNIPLFKATGKDITDLLDATPDMPKDAFVLQVADLSKAIPIPEGADRTLTYLATLNNKAELPSGLRQLVTSLEDTWASHRVRMRKKPADPADPKKPADPKASTKKADGTPATPQQGLESPDNDVVLGKIQ